MSSELQVEYIGPLKQAKQELLAAPKSLQIEYVGPPTEPTSTEPTPDVPEKKEDWGFWDLAEVPSRVGRSFVEGGYSGAERFARAARTYFGTDTGAIINWTERKQKEWAPKGDSPVPGMETIQQGTVETAASLLGTAPALITAHPIAKAFKLSALKTGIMTWAMSAAGVFAGAEFDEIMEGVEEIALKNAATEDEMDEALEVAKPYAIVSAVAEAFGEAVSDIASAWMAMLLGPKAAAAAKVTVKPTVTPGALSALRYLTNRFLPGWAAQVGGEQITTVTQYLMTEDSNAALARRFPHWVLPGQPPLVEQMLTTLGVVTVQSAEMTAILAGAHAAGKRIAPFIKTGKSRQRAVEDRAVDIYKKYIIGDETAEAVADKIVSKPVKTVDKALEELKAAREAKKKPKTKKQKVIETILAAEETAPKEATEDAEIIRRVKAEVPVRRTEEAARAIGEGIGREVVQLDEKQRTQRRKREVAQPSKEARKSQRKLVDREFNLVEEESDRAAIGIRIARELEIDPSDLTTEHLSSWFDPTGIEPTRPDRARLEAIVEATRRKIKGYVSVKEATPRLTPAEDTAVTELMKQDSMLTKAEAVERVRAQEAVPEARPEVTEPAPTEVAEVQPPTPAKMTEEAQKLGPEPKLNVTFAHVFDAGEAGVRRGVGRFVPYVHEPSGTTVQYNPDRHEITNFADYEAAIAETGRELAREEALGKLATEEAIEQHIETEPSSVQNLNIVDKARQAELVNLVKKIAGGDFYSLIRRLIHPRGEAMSARDVANAEGMAELFDEAGVPANQRLAAIKSVAIDAGIYTIEDVALDRFAEGIDFDIISGFEFDRLVDAGRADELVDIGLTEEQVDAVLKKEAEEAAEQRMQEKYNVFEEKITDHAAAEVESAALEERVVGSLREEAVSELASEEKVIPKEQTFKTKREALAERSKKATPTEWAIEKVAERKWTLKHDKQTPATLLNDRVTKHSAHIPLEKANTLINRMREAGRPPDRFTNPKGFLEHLRAALSVAFFEKKNPIAAEKVLAEMAADLEHRSHVFNGDTAYVNEQLKEVRRLQDYAINVREAVNESIIYRGAPLEYVVEHRNRELDLISKVREHIDRLNAPGERGATAADLIDVLRINDKYIPLHLKIILNMLSQTNVVDALKMVDVVTVESTDTNVSYYERRWGRKYDPETQSQKEISVNRIVLDMKSERNRAEMAASAVHEVMHGLTAWAIDNIPRFNTAVTALREAAIAQLNPTDRAALAKLTAKQISENQNDLRVLGLTEAQSPSVYYSLVNNHEFISGAYTSENMQLFMIGKPAVAQVTPYDVATEKDSIWRRFSKAVSVYLLGFKSQHEFNLLDDTIRQVNGIIFEYTNHLANMKKLATDTNVDLTTTDRGTISKNLEGAVIHRNMKPDLNELRHRVNSGEIILQPRPRRDAGWFEQVWISPESIKGIKEDPLALEMAGMCIDAVDQHNYSRTIGFEILDNIFSTLTDTESKQMTSAMRAVEAGEVAIGDIALPTHVKEAAEKLFHMKESYRLRMQEHLKSMLFRSLNQTGQRILNDIFTNGVNAAEATKKWNSYARRANRQRDAFIKKNPDAKPPNREATVTYGFIEDVIQQLKEYETWGLDRYVTRAMKGNIVVLDENGKVVTVGETTKQAAARAIDYLRRAEALGESPGSLLVTAEFSLDKDIATLLTGKQYQALRGRIMRAMKAEAKEIGAIVDKAKADKILKGIVSVRPKETWSMFTREREDVLLGEENIKDIMYTYVHSMEKKMAFDPYAQYMRKHIDKFNDRPGIKKVLEQQFEEARGKYWWSDRVADAAMRRLGIAIGHAEKSIKQMFGRDAIAIPPAWSEKGHVSTRTVRNLRMASANLKLGYRVIASSINLCSGMMHTWIKTNHKYVYNAMKILASSEGKAFINKHAIKLGTSLAMSETGQIKLKTPWWHPMGTFQAVELPNRSVCFMANYLVGRDQGMNEDAAIDFAKRSVRYQQFNYNIASLPAVLRGPGGKVIGQFKSYLMKECEFIRTLTPGEWVKYMSMHLALAGPRGVFLAMKTFPPIMLLQALTKRITGEDWLDEADEWINNNLPRFSRGVFGFFGIDASAPAVFQFPDRWEEWAGITASAMIDFGRMIVMPFLNGEKYLKWGWYHWSKQLSPIWKIWSDMVDANYRDGWVWGQDGKRRYKVDTPWDWMRAAGGFKPLRLGLAELQNRLLAQEAKESRLRTRNIVTNALHMRHRLGDEGVVSQIVQDCLEFKVDPQSLLAAIQEAQLDPLTRRTIQTKLADRLDVYQRTHEIARRLRLESIR